MTAKSHPSTLQLACDAVRTRALGPGMRAAIWVQGCPLRCAECISPHTHAFEGGRTVPVPDLVEALVQLEDVEGLTISGGEPFSQPRPLADLIDALRLRTSWSFMCYSGHRLLDLRRRAVPDVRRLLGLLDVLVDAPYVEALHTAKRWRGSSNQRVHLLTPRYRHLDHSLQDEGLCVEAHLDADGGLAFVGIPPRGFIPTVIDALGARGVVVKEPRC